jgi:hypothetical protein
MELNENDTRPIIIRAEIDKVQEEEMARLVGTTKRALETKRQRGVIPPGVYATIDGRITYSIRRYDQWVESQWPSPQELNSLGTVSASASCGTAAGVAKPSPTRRPRKVSKRPPVSELQ